LQPTPTYRPVITSPPADLSVEAYIEFCRAKAPVAKTDADGTKDIFINPICKKHQSLAIRWAINGGCRALFKSFGLGKTIDQLEICRIILVKHGGRGLIVAPLGVRQEFFHDASLLGTPIKFIRTTGEANETGIHLTNYESVREGKVDTSIFTVLSLDEGSCLRSFGSKTFSEMLFGMAQNVPYRFVATATPSPNEYQELLAYAHFLGIMDIGQARTRFFKRNSEKSDDLTIMPHKEEEFWLWVSSWGLFAEKPSDITGDVNDDKGYDLPELIVHWHEVKSPAREITNKKNGQNLMFADTSMGVSEASAEKRNSLTMRIDKMLDILADNEDDHFILWHDLEDERRAIEEVVPGVVTVYGSQDIDDKEQCISDFSEGRTKYLAGKPVMLGSGTNLQRFCHKAIYLGIGFKFNDFIQSIHRIQRFLQEHQCEIHLIYSDGEQPVKRRLEKKWERDKQLRVKMREIMQKYGLSNAGKAEELTRSLGIKRTEVRGNNYHLINNDSILESKNMADDNIGLIVTSIPFANQYEYSANYMCMGHTDSNQHFFQQMDFLTPELYRMLMPGRNLVVHVKDRIVDSAMTLLGFQTVYPFHHDVVAHFCAHGFAYLGEEVIPTDVVRENNQTYRLGWSEQCKDGSRMGSGLSEYLLIFRKPQTNRAKGYADVPVEKSKEEYPRARWQVDAHGHWRSSGNRLLTPDEWKDLRYKEIFQKFKDWTLNNVYDYDYHVKVSEALDEVHKLPSDFMLLQPASWHPQVLTNITRMRSLNASQALRGKEKHVCPLPFDIVDRAIIQRSMPGESVYDPFAGIGTVPLRAVKHGRFGVGCELNDEYFADSVRYCRAQESKIDIPSFFDAIDVGGFSEAIANDEPEEASKPIRVEVYDGKSTLPSRDQKPILEFTVSEINYDNDLIEHNLSLAERHELIYYFDIEIDGLPIHCEYIPKWLANGEERDFYTYWFNFHGEISETGYRSENIQSRFDIDFVHEDIMNYAKNRATELRAKLLEKQAKELKKSKRKQKVAV
jgi:DNA modification methylase